MEILGVFTQTYDFIYKTPRVSLSLPEAWKGWWLSWEHRHCRADAFMAEKKAVIVNFTEGKGLRVALGCVWGSGQALAVCRGCSLLFGDAGDRDHGSAGMGSSCELSQATSEKGASASTVLLPPF